MSSLLVLSYPTLIFALGHCIFFMLKLKKQFYIILRQKKVMLVMAGLGGLILFYTTCWEDFLQEFPFFAPYHSLLQGGLWGFGSFSFLAFFLLSTQDLEEREVREKRIIHYKKLNVIKKLPFLGLLLGMTVMNLPSLLNLATLSGGTELIRIFFLLSFLPSLLVLYSAKEIYRPAWRSFLFFSICLLLVQLLGVLGEGKFLGSGSPWQILENLLWPIQNFFLFQAINIFLVKEYLRKKLT